MSSGVQVSDQCKNLYQKVKMNLSGKAKLNFAVFKISDDLTQIVPDEERIQLPQDDGRYIVYDYPYKSSFGASSKVILVMWCPSSVSIKKKMLYASSKDALKKCFNDVGGEFQADCAEDLCHKDIEGKVFRKKGNVLVASLALTDILVGLALCVESATWHPELFVLYRTDKASCLARSTWFHVCIISSMVHILAIAADRYLYIVWPFVHMRLATVKTYAVLIAALWVMAAVLGVVPVFVNQFHEYGVCDLAKFQPRGYVAIFAPAFYFICLLGASVLYLLVANLAWKKLRSVGPVGVAGDAEGRINLGRKLKAMRQSIVVFLGFFFSMSPHFIVYIVNDVTPVSHEARLMLGLPAYLNSGVNFFVYMALNRSSA
nr:hypothetical protein BaRGS_003450 [Batillaria attramentaria]